MTYCTDGYMDVIYPLEISTQIHSLCYRHLVIITENYIHCFMFYVYVILFLPLYTCVTGSPNRIVGQSVTKSVCFVSRIASTISAVIRKNYLIYCRNSTKKAYLSSVNHWGIKREGKIRVVFGGSKIRKVLHNESMTS